MERERALEIIKKHYSPDGVDDTLRRALETLIPELRESEDERIRKEIISALKFANDGGVYDKHITYLEKQKDSVSNAKYIDGVAHAFEDGRRKGREEEQKEQKPVQNEEEKEYVKTLKGLVSDFVRDCGGGITDVGYYQRIYDWLDGRHIEQKPELYDMGRWDEESYNNGIHYVLQNPSAYGLTKEQKPADKPKWDDSDMREDENELQTRFAFYTYKDDYSVLYLSNVFVEEASRNHGIGTKILMAAERVAETIGASSICLKVKQNTPVNAWYRKRGYAYVAFEDGYDWLQKNLEYMKPAEWSEEDEKDVAHIIRILNDCYAYGKHDLSKTDHENLVNKLKSLRPHWKPSEEQMRCLDMVLCDEAMDDNVHSVLVQLREQLKKLMKEDWQ